MSTDGYQILLDTLDGGTAASPATDRAPDAWESAAQATCECLSWRGALDNLERRHAEDELGETTYREFPVHARSVIVTAHKLMESGAFSPGELQDRMAAIRERLNRT
ncbi:nitrile hydratase subunit beta [Mycobacterium sp. 21AC1]|nr:SH3-like domain-containing protein [Mycobacterium sp. 21AC1]MDV3126326.1 nitrile hydratase subunit beta [Mycobacterium sp. 21AC1]